MINVNDFLYKYERLCGHGLPAGASSGKLKDIKKAKRPLYTCRADAAQHDAAQPPLVGVRPLGPRLKRLPLVA